MICLKPFRFGLQEFGCGQCLPCRINKSRLWVTRLMLEASQHQASLFVTLTYSPEHLPADGSVCPKAMQEYLKRLRWRLGVRKIRFFGVGEYGDRTFRPHYHLVLFGCSDLAAVDLAWGFGFVHVTLVSEELLRYICGYITKKMTKVDDPRLSGRHPEFARMSRHPGIGGAVADEIARHVNTFYGARKFAAEGDVPMEVRFSGQKWPLGRYMRSRIRDASGYSMDRYSAVRSARSKVQDGTWVKKVVEAEQREQKRRASGERARFLRSIRKGSL